MFHRGPLVCMEHCRKCVWSAEHYTDGRAKYGRMKIPGGWWKGGWIKPGHLPCGIVESLISKPKAKCPQCGELMEEYDLKGFKGSECMHCSWWVTRTGRNVVFGQFEKSDDGEYKIKRHMSETPNSWLVCGEKEPK